VRLEADSGVPSGKIVAELQERAHALRRQDDRQGLLATILRGDKVGVIGPNGAGKTTLLKLILGELAADLGHGAPGHAARGRVLRPDAQHARPRRDARRHDQPGQRMGRDRRGRKHVMSYLTDFLFSPERANSPVRTLSGGERNRVLLARAVRAAGERAGARRADQRPRHRHPRAARGAAADVCRHGVPGQPRPALPRQRRHQHDRLGGRRLARRWREYEGGYEDGKVQRERARGLAAQAERRSAPARTEAAAAAPPARPAARGGPKAKKLSYKEQRELDACRRGSRRSSSSRRSSPRCSSSADFYADDPAASSRRRCASRRSTTS
jgi:ATP-binding cassette subfamily F protein uup